MIQCLFYETVIKFHFFPPFHLNLKPEQVSLVNETLCINKG